MPSTPRVLVLQHGHAGPPGVLGEWMADRGLEPEIHASWSDPVPRTLDGYDAVASLGSQYSADAGEPGWIADEIALLKRAVEEDVPVLGLCFGGQALAVALGGGVRRASIPEVGWVEVATTAPDVVAPGPWLQFHWDVFDPPVGAEVLGHTPAGPAAFRHGRHLGTQFHPEVTPPIVEEWVAMMPGELEELGVDGEDLRAAGLHHAPGARANAFRLFDAWWERARR